ncbi:MAG: universal stress protein [Nitrososphaera sp.]|jgi:nucleotide-binding universal stress UspA family protein
MVSRILVPHDGAEMADKALEKAIEFAKPLKAEILVVHIIDDRFVPPSATLGFISDRTSLEDAKFQLIKILKAGAEKMLQDRLSRVEKAGIKTEFVLGVGSPSTEIVRIAKETKADLIVIGSRQLKGDTLITLGSVARKVSEMAHCPVMIIR